MRQVTLSVISYDNKILLGMKKRGFWKDRWNGFGGKPDEEEPLLDCMVRETEEEAGIILKNLELVGIIDFFLQINLKIGISRYIFTKLLSLKEFLLKLKRCYLKNLI